MRRNEVDLPEGHRAPAGIGLKRNPGACCVWVTRDFKVIREGDGILFRLGDPERTLWMAQGRPATRAEVEESIASGLHFLEDVAEEDGPEAQKDLATMIRRAEALLPAV
jgi:hypothetical protein